jgi:hypothetical protein
MRFYTEQHQFYCGIDLHTRIMFLCVLNQAGKICFEKNINSNPDDFLSAIDPFAARLPFEFSLIAQSRIHCELIGHLFSLRPIFCSSAPLLILEITVVYTPLI